MAQPVCIRDSDSGNKVRVNGEGEIGVVIHTHPPLDETITAYPFRQFMTNSSDSNNMIVDGSTTPQEFNINASADRDIFVKSVSFRIGDNSSVSLNKFGGLTALTNGCALCFQNDALGAIVIADELKTNLDMVRLGVSTGAVGTGTDAYKLDISGGGAEDTYLPFIDFSQVFGFSWGLRLKKGSNDKLFLTVNDALAGLVTFNSIAYGSQL